VGNTNILGGVNRPISSSLMNRSLTLNPSSLNITNQNQDKYGNAVDEMKKSNDFNDYVKKINENARNGQVSVPANKDNSFIFGSGDLKSAFHKVNAGFTGTQSSDGSWNLNVSIQDKYNYELDKGGYAGDTLFTTLNKAAYFSQNNGVISSYDVNVNFNYNYSQR
jgi:hypothetical protein